MPSPNAIAPLPSTASFQLSTVNPRLFCSKPFRLTQFRKNASANPLDSHTFKTKDLKSFLLIHFQKKVGGTPVFLRWTPVPGHRRFCLLSTVNCGRPTSSHQSLVTSHQSLFMIEFAGTREE